MNPISSEVGFILLVAIVLIGIIVYAYVTVMRQEKSPSSTEISTHPPSKFTLTNSFSEFSKMVNEGQPAELPVAITELGRTLTKLLDNLINAGFEPLPAADNINANLVAECPQCHTRISAKSMTSFAQVECATPGCQSTVYTLRWMAVPGDLVTAEIIKEL